ncbi:glycosyltransferase family 4 protein [Geodermatophilus marinus]|uniref:glycosyltransferase family 4 protein n=1 Tax=Geodermatophilus sp. LHW52908 TaxID=2303986 RepID=UPI001314A631|nr:glycosyltransferase family 4 protein [Geodermatophilus sp. LHW52908]
MSRVLLVGKGAPDRGGIPTFLETLIDSSLAEEHEVRFLNVAHSSTPQATRPTMANVGRTLRDAVAVWRAARGRDIVHIHSALAATVTVMRASLLAVAARARGCAVVIHAHGGNIQDWLTTSRRRTLLRLAMTPAHRVIAVWTAGRAALSAVLPAEQVGLIENGVPVDLYDSARSVPTHEPPRLLYVGLLTPRKGVLDLLAASRMLRQRGVVHELWLLGGTPDEGPAAEAEVRAQLDGNVRLLGTRPPEEMPAAFAAADVFCLPSWWEAMPLSVLEAMAAGLPVVASDVGDVGRAVAHGMTGYVIPPRAPERLASALEPLLTDPELRRRMGAAGRARVEESFSAAGTVRAVSDLYRELRARAS